MSGRTTPPSVPGPREVDAALAFFPEDVRAALQRVRSLIAAAAPGAVETIAYGVPAFKYRGRPFVSYGAGRTATSTCALYVQSPALMDAHADELRGLDTSKGTIRFRPSEPLSADLITMLVTERMAEIDRNVRA